MRKMDDDYARECYAFNRAIERIVEDFSETILFEAMIDELRLIQKYLKEKINVQTKDH